MDNEMIKRVSKAIIETPNSSDYKTLVAINAIKAIREPTQIMITKGIDIGDDLGWGCYYTNYKNVYQAIIDAIIGD